MFSGSAFSSCTLRGRVSGLLKTGGDDLDGALGADMLTKSAPGALIGNYRIHPPLQIHGPPLDGTSFITTATHQLTGPGIAFGPIKFCIPHVDFFNGDVEQGIGWADGAAAQAEVAGCFPGIDLRGAGNKKIKSPPHLDTVKDAHLGALATLKAPGQKLLFRTGAWWPEKFFSLSHLHFSRNSYPCWHRFPIMTAGQQTTAWRATQHPSNNRVYTQYQSQKKGQAPIDTHPFFAQVKSIVFFLPRILRISTLVSRLPSSSISSSTVI